MSYKLMYKDTLYSWNDESFSDTKNKVSDLIFSKPNPICGGYQWTQYNRGGTRFLKKHIGNELEF